MYKCFGQHMNCVTVHNQKCTIALLYISEAMYMYGWDEF